MKGCDIVVTTESVTIKVPVGMSKYLVTMNPETELTRNALLLYPYILNQTISHGHAAEILGIRKSELIDLYDKLGYSYFDMTLDDLDEELNTFKQLKKKEQELTASEVKECVDGLQRAGRHIGQRHYQMLLSRFEGLRFQYHDAPGFCRTHFKLMNRFKEFHN